MSIIHELMEGRLLPGLCLFSLSLSLSLSAPFPLSHLVLSLNLPLLMMEAMQSQSCALEKQLSAITEQLARQDTLFSKMDAFSTTLQQHHDTLDMVQKSPATQQAMMTEMMSKLIRNDKPTSSPPLLPLLSSPPLLSGSTKTVQQPTNATRLPKLEIPLIIREQVLNWVFQIEHFFHFHQIIGKQRLKIAAFYMSGPALQWYHWMHATNQLSTLAEFVPRVKFRFGPSSFVNHEAQHYKFKQRTTVTTYLGEFEALCTLISGLTPSNLLNCFLSGLREDIQHKLYVLKPVDLHEAIGITKLIKDKCNSTHVRTWTPPTFLSPPPQQTQETPKNQPPSIPIKSLTPTEMLARQEKGLCFNCDAKFTPWHRCHTPQFLCLLTEEEEPTDIEPELPCTDESMEVPPPEEPLNTVDLSNISFHA